MAVGSSQPTVVGTKDGRIGIKSQMQVKINCSFGTFAFAPTNLKLMILCLSDLTNKSRSMLLLIIGLFMDLILPLFCKLCPR